MTLAKSTDEISIKLTKIPKQKIFRHLLSVWRLSFDVHTCFEYLALEFQNIKRLLTEM